MKKLLVLLVLILFLGFVFAGTIGDRCEYPVYQDTECDDTNNIYCIDYSCAFYDGTAPFCSDTDGDNSSILGTVNYISRDSVGNFVEQNYTDYCELEGNPVDSCEGVDCNVVEFYCTPSRTIDYSYKDYFCEFGCSNGVCLPEPEPVLPQVGDPCINDTECSESGLYCVNGFCAVEPEVIVPDINALLPPEDTNLPEDINLPDEPIPQEDFSPTSVSDAELLEYIEQWANGELTDQEIQTIIEVWKNA